MSNPLPSDTALLLVDHGSKRRAANDLLEEVANLFRQAYPAMDVGIAHMELAEPTVFQGITALKEKGAMTIVVHPYFLGPGRHVTEDIPALIKEAARAYPDLELKMTAPLGLHPKMAEIMMDRIQEARVIEG
jgi:sirohydrochlorin ferrochelatase